MENRLKVAKELIAKMSIRINRAHESGDLKLIEADILMDVLKQTYIVIEELRNDIISKSGDKELFNSAKLTDDIKAQEYRQSETEKHPETIIPVEAQQISHLVDQQTEPKQNNPIIEQQSEVKQNSSIIEQQGEVKQSNPNTAQQTAHSNLSINQQQESNQPQEPVQPEIYNSQPMVEEVPVMTFPKVELTIESPQQESDAIQQTPVREIYSAPSNAEYEKPKIDQPPVSSVHSMPGMPTKQTTNKSSSADLFGGQTIADKLKSETPSLNEKITRGRSDQSLADKMQLKPISDLKTAIGINEKFQFVNDLFEGRIDLYNEAINQLNNCAAVISAESILESLKAQHQWKDETEAFNKLRVFINRRYL